MADSLTPFRGQIPIRVKGQTTCIYHHGKSLDLYCESCQEIACVDCTSSTHSGHDFLTLSNFSAKKKAKLHKLITKKETKSIPSIRRSIKAIDANIKQTDTTFNTLAADVMKQRDKLKRKIDTLADQTLAVYEKLKAENITLLADSKEKLKTQYAVLQKKIQECRTLIQTGEDIGVHDCDTDIESPVVLPVKPTLNIASFSPNLVPLDNLKYAFGTVTKGSNKSNVPVTNKSELPKDKSEASAQQGSGLPEVLTSHAEQRTVTSDKQLESNKNKKWNKAETSHEHPQNDPVQQPAEFREVKIPCILLARMRNGDTWMDEVYRQNIVRKDRDGKLQDIIYNRRQITDFYFSSQRQELWMCSMDDNSIIEVTSAPTTPRFYTDESPLCICVTMDGHIIVGMSKQVTKFNSQGDVIITTKPTLLSIFSKQIVCIPRYITECPVTKNIAVVDRKSKNVLVMDKAFNELFRYPRHLKNSVLMSIELFIPNRITYCPNGSIFIEDIGNNILHMTSGSGELDSIEVIGINSWRLRMQMLRQYSSFG